MRRLTGRLTYANVMSTIAVFGVLGGGTAYAVTQIDRNSVKSKHIVNDQVKSVDVRDDTLTGGGLTDADLRAGSVGSSEVGDGQLQGVDVKDDSLGGADIAESSLGQVPSALLGGMGRWSGGSGTCDPQGEAFVNCAVVTPQLPARSRLLLIGQVTAHVTSPDWGGACRLGSTSGPLLGTTTTFVPRSFGQSERASLVAVTDVFPPGQHSFGVECNQHPDTDAQVRFDEASITALAISPD